MLSFKKLVAASVAALVMSGSAATASVVYATSVDWNGDEPTGFISSGTPDNTRKNPVNALGAPDDRFLQLREPGDTAIFGFDTLFDLSATVFEITFNCRQTTEGFCSGFEETLDVYTTTVDSFSGDQFDLATNGWTKQGTITNGNAQGGGLVSLSVGGPFTFLALTDVSANPSSNKDIGFDVDAVGVSPVPLPAAAWMLLSAIGFLTAVARRRSPTA
ncbi:MAG: VPLPA-CTERM sorting domain-containing protein [Halieaceae bacterium]|jgi:hypothetical protein|nr:VPLPA-CTERM sorting domain-containing protein [Halieaceae bacterium]